MRLSRRRFLSGSLMCAPALFLNRLPVSTELKPVDAARALAITNFNAGNRAAIVEGRTLLAAFSFPQPVAAIDGSLPVEIAPASQKGATLVEPQPLYFYPLGDASQFATILSAPLDALRNTSAEMRLRAHPQGAGADEPFTSRYEILPGDYRASHLTLSTDFSSPSAELRERMRRDFETMVEIYRRRTSRRWRDAFIHPVACSHRNNFGDRRVVNGTKCYRHAGLDYNAPLGTGVHAMNDGRVVLSTEQWVPGQTVCIDHGGGVFTKYLHLSKRHVSEGDEVRRGEVIGLSGQSGGQRPGPHLHLDVVVNGSHVDPLAFVQTAAQLCALESGSRSLKDLANDSAALRGATSKR